MARLKTRDLYQINGNCGICGHRILRLKHANIDHIIPKSQGGGDYDHNLQISHRWCNQVKGNLRRDQTFKPTFAWNIKMMALFEMGLLSFGHDHKRPPS